MNKFRFIKVRDVKSPSRGNEGDAGLAFYIPEDLTLQDLVKSNYQNQVEYHWNIILRTRYNVFIFAHLQGY